VHELRARKELVELGTGARHVAHREQPVGQCGGARDEANAIEARLGDETREEAELGARDRRVAWLAEREVRSDGAVAEREGRADKGRRRQRRLLACSRQQQRQVDGGDESQRVEDEEEDRVERAGVLDGTRDELVVGRSGREVEVTRAACMVIKGY
jgi:hypothetical protein